MSPLDQTLRASLEYIDLNLPRLLRELDTKGTKDRQGFGTHIGTMTLIAWYICAGDYERSDQLDRVMDGMRRLTSSLKTAGYWLPPQIEEALHQYRSSY